MNGKEWEGAEVDAGNDDFWTFARGPKGRLCGWGNFFWR